MADNSFSYVSLLLHCNGSDASTTFTDSGPDARTVSVFGNAQIDTAQSKFGSASALFDGTGDYLTLPDEPGLNLDSGDFTIEMWVRMNSGAATQTILNKALTTGNSQYRIFYNSATVRFNATVRNSANTTTVTCAAPSTLSVSTWYHVAFVRSGDNFTLYVDGVAGAVQTQSGALFATTETVSIGGNNNGSTAFNGWLDEVRITKGYARYTANFTAPTAAFESGTIPVEKNFAYVALLLHGDGSDASTTVTDSSSSAKTVTVLGNAQIDTAQSQFGGASILFDGTTDYLTVPNSTTANTGTNLSSGNFTVEMWVRFNSVGTTQYLARHANGTTMWALLFDSSTSRIRFVANNAAASQSIGISSLAGPSTATWYHVAGVRDGNLFSLYIGGVLQSSATLSGGGALFASTAAITIGSSDSGATALNGWLDDFRITHVARYTAAFTPPAAAFQNGNDTFGTITTAAMFGAAALFGFIEVIGSITTAAILGGTPGAKLYGGLTVGTITTSAILGGTPGAKLFGSLVHGRIVMYGILSPEESEPQLIGIHDFTDAVVDKPTNYVMDLLTDEDADTRVRVPISSWQSTLQVTELSYLSCVVPSCEEWLETMDDASHFIVSRSVILDDGSVLEAEISRAPLDTLQIYQGSTNYTASLSGYTDAYEANDDPDAARDRTLTDIRTRSTYVSGVRVRCAIDWLLRPAQRAFYAEDLSMIVSYMNMYANDSDQYMDVGERIVSP